MAKKITIQDNIFIDDKGNQIVPCRINMVCKDKAQGYIGDYTAKDFKWLKEQGFNLIRLGIFWDAVEPEPGIYDDNYLAQIDQLVGLAGNQGIAVFLDMHQDLYGIVFEDGAPAWATFTDDQEHVRTELWSESYLLSPAVQHAFDNFWANTPASDGIGIMDHYVNAWVHIASRFADNDYVIGYDIMNEPFPGTPGAEVGGIIASVLSAEGADDISNIADPEALMGIIAQIEPIPAAFEENSLNPFYSKVAQAIRKVDPHTIIMIESNYFANAGIPSHLEAPTYADGSPIPYVAYAPHGYDILVDTDEYSVGGNERVDLIFGSVGMTIARLGLPTLIGEWGCYPNASEAQLAQARHLLELFDRMGVGNVYFDFSHIYDGKIIKALF